MTPFKVIKGHRCGTSRKPTRDFLLAIYSKLHHILHRFQLQIIGEICWYLSLMCSLWANSKVRTMKFVLNQLETSLYRVM